MSSTAEAVAERSRWVRALAAFPRGGMLPAENWRRRHQALSLVLLWHFPFLLGYGLYRGYPVPHTLADAGVPVLLGALSFLPRVSRGFRSVFVAAGLISCSVVLVHQSHGLIEMHFHFFVIVALLTLYQDWKPFLVAITLTVLEHGVMGVLSPRSVYNHPDAWEHPWRWAFVHGAFVVAASAASITAWAMSEADHRAHKAEMAKLHEERLALVAHEAYHDMLTTLPNRRMVADHVRAAAARCARSGRLLGVLFVDLDRFKQVNDSYGHLIGDVVLKETGERLRASVRGSDIAARLGGDEFVVVLEGLEDEAALDAAAARVQRALVGPIRVDDDLTLSLTASIGRVLAGADDNWEHLIERADLDMYRVKHLSHDGTAAGRIPSQR